MSNNKQEQLDQNGAAVSFPFEPNLSEATIKQALAPFINIAGNDADASRETNTSSEDAGAAHDNGVEEVAVADTAGTGHYAKSVWDEGTARISRLLASSWSDVPLSEAGQQAESALDAVEGELRLSSELTSYFGRDGMTSGVAAERLNRSLGRLQEAELAVYQPKGGTHQTLPCFPRFLYLSAQVLNEGIESGFIDGKSGTVQMFFDRADGYLERAMRSAFGERRLKINMELAGPRKELAYIYDHQTEESLTEWVPLTDDSAPVLLRTLDLLRDRIADAFVQTLPFAEMQAALVTVSGAGQAPTGWSELRELLMVPGLLPADEAPQGTSDAPESTPQGEEVVVTRTAIRELLLPRVGAQHVPELAPDAQAPASLRVDWKPMAQSVLAEFTNEVIKRQFTEVTKKLIATIPLGAVAPGIGILLDLIFPSEKPITKEEMAAEIDKRIKQALDQAYVEVIKLKFENCRKAFNMRMQTVQNDNSIGAPQDWEPLLIVTGDLEGFLFAGDQTNPGDFTRYYLTHQLLTDAMLMRLHALYGKLQAAKPGDLIDAELDALKECYTGWFSYLERLLTFVWNNPREENDFVITKSHYVSQGSAEKFVINDHFNHKGAVVSESAHENRLSTEYPSRHDKAKLNVSLATIKQKARLFTALNTTFKSMCEVYDAAARKHQEKFGGYLPMALGPLFNTRLAGSYFSSMNKFAIDNPYSDGGGKDQFTWSPSSRAGLYRRDYNDFSVTDLYVTTGSRGGTYRFYSVGDYADLKRDGNDAQEMTEMRFPRGLRAFCYSEPNFGQYRDEMGNIKYKGDFWVLPVSTHSPYEVIHGRDIRSMKIRLDLKWWHNSRAAYGRIKGWKWADDTVYPPQIANLELIDLS